MKRIYLVFLTLLLLFSLCGVSSAALTSYSSVNGVVVDDRGTTDGSDDLYWFADLTHFNSNSYTNQISTIGALNSDVNYQNAAYGDWHLASLSETISLWDNTDTSITNLFVGASNSARYNYSSLPNFHNVAYIDNTNGKTGLGAFGPMVPDLAPNTYGAWVTADSTSVAPVPEPATMLLLGSGIIGLAGFRRKFRKL